MLTIERIIELRDVIKWHTVFREAGLNASTMRSAVRNGRELRADEADAMTRALAKKGVHLSEGYQTALFTNVEG